MSRVTLEGGQVLVGVHPETACAGRPCPIHNRSEHSMRHLPQHFREDTGLMERICEHGVGHPDFDSLPFFEERGIYGMGIHGCCGCCRPLDSD